MRTLRKKKTLSSSIKLTPRKRKIKKEKKAPPVEDDDIYKEPLKRIIKPSNQLELTADELKADITRVLTGDDPNRPKNIVKFSHKDQCFKLDPPGLADHMAVHYVRDGCSLHIDSKEYKGQKQRENLKKEAEEKQRKALDEGTSSSASITLCKEKTKNQFNFSDRSTQTLNNQLKTIYVGTEPPPVAQYSANVSQSQIYDHYVSELMMANMGHVENGLEQNHIDNNEEEDEEEDDDGSSCSENDEDFGIRSDDMVKALKIVERLVNQNSQDEMYQDFKYWEDASDQYRRGEGSLLPLWRFVYERTRRKQVTSLCWNPRNSDLFAVGYGSYNFLQQESGLVCCFSLKNTSYPEYIFPTESGVLSLDFNSEHPSLLAIGCYDGNVHVYDVASSSTKPIYSSTISTGQHKDPVWQVHWEKEELGENLNFYSISSDGNVFNWSMSKNELKMEPVIQLKFIPLAKNDSEEMAITGLASGCCFDFNRKHDHLFLVGTEEGNIYKCSKSYSGQYLQTYSGHHMAVYAVQWNSFDDDIFISCSADWTVKLWDHTIGYPLLSLDLGNAVGDVIWSPYSSTIFSAVTSDGKVHVYDLYENKQDPLCVQKVVKRARLTKARFNNDEFILIVGDDKGGVNSLKLSPNLRDLHLPVSDEKPEINHSGEQEEEVIHAVDVGQIQREKMQKLRALMDTKPKR